MVRLSLLALLVGLAPAASAQMAVEAAGAAGTLSPGAEPAQVSFDVRAVADVGEYVSDAECVGTVDPSAPDVVVEWGGGDLRVWVRAPFDATLAVARPDGRWACNDDFEGLSPVVELADAPAGRYAVWLGSFSPDPFETSATLYAGTPPPPPVLDAGAAPLAGTITAAGGFEATQGAIEVAVSAGNADRVDAIDLSGTPDPPGFCGGTIDAGQPSAAIAYTADGGTGTLAIGAMDLETDLVLVVQAPDGRVYCNDDFVDRNPLVAVTDPPSGTYVVWVGTFAGGASAGAPTLTIAETAPENDFGDFDFDGDFGPTPFTEGTYTVLDIGAVPSVRLVATAAEGASQEVTVQPVAANPVQGGSCSGYVETIATAAVTLSGDGPFALTASAADDLTLTVRTPTGRWFCSDDADGLDPGVQIDDAEAGDYLVWVGTFGELGGTTERDAGGGAGRDRRVGRVLRAGAVRRRDPIGGDVRRRRDPAEPGRAGGRGRRGRGLGDGQGRRAGAEPGRGRGVPRLPQRAPHGDRVVHGAGRGVRRFGRPRPDPRRPRAGRVVDVLRRRRGPEPPGGRGRRGRDVLGLDRDVFPAHGARPGPDERGPGPAGGVHGAAAARAADPGVTISYEEPHPRAARMGTAPRLSCP